MVIEFGPFRVWFRESLGSPLDPNSYMQTFLYIVLVLQDVPKLSINYMCIVIKICNSALCLNNQNCFKICVMFLTQPQMPVDN